MKQKETKPKEIKKPKKKKVGFLKKKEEVKKEVEEEKTSDFDELIKEKATKEPNIDNDVGELLPILDELLEQLPEDVIDEFAHSEKFTLYEKVMNKYKKK